MTIIPAGDVTALRTTKHTSQPRLSIFTPTTILAAQVAGAHNRGARSLAYDNGTGTFSLIRSYQALWVGTVPGGYDVGIVRIKSISGTAASGTIVLDENGILFADNHFLTIKHHYPPFSIYPRISGGIFYKFYNTAFPGFPAAAPPVCLAGPSARVGQRVAGSLVFNFDLSNSYAVAQGASIASYSLTVAPATGATVAFDTGTGVGTITVTIDGEWWATASCTDSNGQSQERFVALKADPSPYLDYELAGYDAAWGSGVRLSLNVFGDTTLADFPDEALVVEWFRGEFDEVEDYVNVFELSEADDILTVAYIRRDTSSDDFSGPGTHQVTFEATTIDSILDNIHLDSVSLDAVTSPAAWHQYPRWLTVGRAIHHLLKWHSSIFELCDVVGLLANTLFIKTAKMESGSLRGMANTLAEQRGIFAQLTSDRTGRLHLAVDSQMLNTAGRAALDTILELSEADVSGPITTMREPEARAYAAQVSGFAFDGVASTPYVSIIPGYRESNVSYALPGHRGNGFTNRPNQVLSSQTDSNEKVGRIFAVENRPIREFRITFRGNYVGALTVIPTYGWYEMGIANASLGRELAVNAIRLICRSYSLRSDNGDFVTSAVFEPEALGPDGFQGNYPTGIPAPTNSPAPRWDAPGSLPALASFSSVWYRDDNDSDWTQLSSQAFNHGAIDPWWRVKRQSTDPRDMIWWGVGEAGLIMRARGISKAPVDLTPVSNPPDTWSSTPAPAVADLSMIQVIGDPWIEDRVYVLARAQVGGVWQGWLLYSDVDGESWNYVELYDGVTLPGQVYPTWLAVNGEGVFVTLWADAVSDELRLLLFDKDLVYLDEISLGAATLAEVTARELFAFPTTVTDNDELLYVAGRMVDPVGLTGTYHVVESTTAGSLASWTSIENGWGADICVALRVDDVDNFFGVRTQPGGVTVDPNETLLVSTNNNDEWDAAKASATKFVVIFTDGSNVRAVAIEISGGVTIGSEVVLKAIFGASMGVAYLEDDKVIALYEDDNAGELYTSVLTLGGIDGLTITQGAEKTVRASGASGSRIAAVSATKAVAVYRASSQGRGAVLDVSGTTITVNSEDTWTTSSVSVPEPRKVGSGIMVVCRAVSNTRLHAAMIYNITTSFDASSLVEIDTSQVFLRFNATEYIDDAIALAYKPDGVDEVRVRVIEDVASLPFVYAADAHSDGDMSASFGPGLAVNNSGAGVFGYALTTPSAGGHTRTFNIASNLVTIGSEDVTWETGTDAWVYRNARLSDSLFALLASAGANIYLLTGVAAASADFYQGAGALALKFTLPYPVASPGALALRGDGVVAIGGSEAGAGGELVTRASAADSYAAGTDVTDSLTGAPINGLSWINGDN